MKLTPLGTSLLGTAGLLLASSTLHAQAINTSAAPQGTQFTVSNTDLLQASGTTHTTTVTSSGATIDETTPNTNSGSVTFSDGTDTGAFAGIMTLTNGTAGTLPPPGNTPKNRADFAGITGDVTLTFSLDLGASAAGYDLSRIDAYSFWNNSGRDGINVTLSYATVGNPNTFIAFTGASALNDNPDTALSPVAEMSSLVDASGGLLATGVGAVRFVFPGQENNGVGYSELDVTGVPTATVPEPSTWAMMVGGIGLLLGAQRFRTRRA